MTRHTHAFGFKMSELIKHKQTESTTLQAADIEHQEKRRKDWEAQSQSAGALINKEGPRQNFFPPLALKQKSHPCICFLKFYFRFISFYRMFCLHMYACHPQRSEEGVTPPGTRVIVSHHVCWEANQPLKDVVVLLLGVLLLSFPLASD